MSSVSYVLSGQQRNLFKTQSRVADHVANVNTSGYKAARNVFSELVVHKGAASNDTSFAKIEKVHRDFSQGEMKATYRDLDVAIQGPGFFRLETPLGERYTRAGDFVVNERGVLVSKEGYPVIGPGGGFIELAEGDTNISIKEDGLLSANGEERGQIGIFQFNSQDQQLLRRAGNGLYISNGIEPEISDSSKIAQGMLEGSNVSSVKEMSTLIEVSRRIEENKSLLKGYHDNQMSMISQLSRAN